MTTKNNAHPRQLEPKPRDYQPSKAELQEEMDMPAIPIERVRKAVFRPLAKREKANERH